MKGGCRQVPGATQPYLLPSQHIPTAVVQALGNNVLFFQGCTKHQTLCLEKGAIKLPHLSFLRQF